MGAGEETRILGAWGQGGPGVSEEAGPSGMDASRACPAQGPRLVPRRRPQPTPDRILSHSPIHVFILSALPSPLPPSVLYPSHPRPGACFCASLNPLPRPGLSLMESSGRGSPGRRSASPLQSTKRPGALGAREARPCRRRGRVCVAQTCKARCTGWHTGVTRSGHQAKRARCA